MPREIFTTVKGMDDISSPDISIWQFVEDTARSLFESYGLREVRTPILEKTQLFVRSIGEGSAVVGKEMYTFIDQGGESLTLRPEATASVVRHYVSQGANQGVGRYYYIGPMFRRERPQKGRKRQFHQIGVEVIGALNPAVDAEVISMCSGLFSRLGVSDYRLELNSVGCKACRGAYETNLKGFLLREAHGLCEDCRSRIERNPLRVFDCKNEGCIQILKGAPFITDHLCNECLTHLDGVKRYLDSIGVSYITNPKIVRGLDYYTKTAFEFVSTRLGAQSAVAGGGRYDGLAKALGGDDVGGVGFSIGMERLIMLLDGDALLKERSPVVFFAVLGDKSLMNVMPLMNSLRNSGIECIWDYELRSLKAQMRLANKLGAKWVAIIGEDEIKEGVLMLKDMRHAAQEKIPLSDVVERLRNAALKDA